MEYSLPKGITSAQLLPNISAFSCPAKMFDYALVTVALSHICAIRLFG
jgi:hypothetical protein